MLEHGAWLKYEDPVMGPPWSLPFEFPLYQWIVAESVRLTGERLLVAMIQLTVDMSNEDEGLLFVNAWSGPD
jgi:hypothetical protein